MEKQKYSIDVIVAAYNAEDTIIRCINSILNQHCNKVNIIVVDDGSTDNTYRIVSEISATHPEKIKLLTQENAGPAAARNLGISNSKADFIGFVDADDYISESMYFEMLDVVDAETDLVICGRYDILKDGESKAILPNIKNDNTNVFNNKELLSGTSVFVWDKIYRREVIESFSLTFPETIRYAEDAVFLNCFKLHVNKCRVVSLPLYFYTEHREGSITRECTNTWLDIPKALELINKYYLQQGRFFEFWKQLETISIGFFRRRINSLSTHTNKRMQFKYVKAQIKLMDEYFPNWRKRFKSPLYSNKIITTFFVFTPNFIKKSVYSFLKIVKKSTSKKMLYRYFQKYLPLNNTISLYISYSGDSISDNPLYMAKSAKKYNSKIYFASRRLAQDKIYCRYNKLQFEVVSTSSIKYLWLLAVSGLIVTNSRVPTFFNKRKKQTLINTWHGTPIKTLGASMVSGIKDIGRNQNQFLMSDYLLFPNNFTKEKMYADFGLESLYAGVPIFSGYPRNDAFVYQKENLDNIRSQLGISDKKVIVYMPTWRGTSIGTIDREKYINELVVMLKNIDDDLSDNSVIFVKLHQSVSGSISDTEFKNIKKFPDGYDTYEFLSISDILVTDYSSVMFDYLYSNKPIVLFLYDYKEYAAERGFYIDVKETPFEKSFDDKELVSILNNDISFDYGDYVNLFCLDTKSDFSSDVWNSIDSDLNDKLKVSDDCYNIVFVGGVLTKDDEDEILSAAKKSNTIIVWHHSDIDNITERFIYDNKRALMPFVIAPGEMPVTVGEKLFLMINEKTGFLNNVSRNIYKNEFDRILPGVNILNVKNKSSRNKFKLMTVAFNNVK